MKLLPLILLAAILTAPPAPPTNTAAIHVRNPNLPPYTNPPAMSGIIWYALPPSNNCFAAVLVTTNMVDFRVLQTMPADGHLHLAQFPPNNVRGFVIAYFPTNSSNGLSIR